MHYMQQGIEMASRHNVKPLLEYLSGGAGANNTQNHTFSSLNFGAAAADRLLIASLFGYFPAPSNPVTLTVGGVAMTVHIATANNTHYRHIIASALVPTGTSGSLVINWNQSQENTAYALYSLKNYMNRVPFLTQSTVAGNSLNLDLVPGAVAIATNNNNGASVSGADWDLDLSGSGNFHSASKKSGINSYGTHTISLSGGSTDNHLTAAAWR